MAIQISMAVALVYEQRLMRPLKLWLTI